MFSYPVEFLQIFITQILNLVQRLLLFATLVTLLSAIAIYLNSPQILKTNLSSQNDVCYNTHNHSILTISHWSFGSIGVAASKCEAKKYRIIKIKIPYKLEDKIKLKKQKRKIKVKVRHCNCLHF